MLYDNDCDYDCICEDNYIYNTATLIITAFILFTISAYKGGYSIKESLVPSVVEKGKKLDNSAKYLSCNILLQLDNALY